jgi:hypothetical protein
LCSSGVFWCSSLVQKLLMLPQQRNREGKFAQARSTILRKKHQWAQILHS